MSASADDGAAVGGRGRASRAVERAVPYNCPFCAEEDLRPLESGAVPGLDRGGWHCRGCLRVFSVAFHGIHEPSSFSAAPELSGSDPR